MNGLESVLLAVGLVGSALHAQRLQIATFSVGPDQTLTYPNTPGDPNRLLYLPDEHTTIIPPASGSGPYLVFAAAQLSGLFGAVVLQTTDLRTFDFATPQGYNRQVLASPNIFSKCNSTDNTEFDENYAAPGSVVHDPTLPPGNLIMLYEAENHCPGGVNQQDFYATVGFARSSDNGKTWPVPAGGVQGGSARHPILQSADPQPTTAHGYIGNAIPTGFIDRNANGDYYLYVSYGHYSPGNPLSIGVARAKLGVASLDFEKWYNGSFSQPGIGGLDSDPIPAGGCAAKARSHPEITFNDDLELYVMVYWCDNGPTGANSVAWFYSTATSLDRQDWTPPRFILNSQMPQTTPCDDGSSGTQMDGWYPSFMSPGAAAGHTRLTGMVFFLRGCMPGSDRQFRSRAFTITAGPPGPQITQVVNAAAEDASIAPNTWVEIKGANLAPSGDTRIWGGSDFVNNKMPTSLDGVSATVNGKPAFVYYISPGQINVLTPPDAMPNSVQVIVTSAGVVSSPFTVQAQALSPSFFLFNGGPYVAATHADGSYLGPASLFPGATTPSKPGETIVLYANGFGPTTNPVVSGSITQSGSLSPLPAVKIGGVAATVVFAGLISPGEFQFNVLVPPSLADGDQPVIATYNGTNTPSGALISVQH
jgi:uncharacterized protein (TIGR03437 family)